MDAWLRGTLGVLCCAAPVAVAGGCDDHAGLYDLEGTTSTSTNTGGSTTTSNTSSTTASTSGTGGGGAGGASAGGGGGLGGDASGGAGGDAGAGMGGSGAAGGTGGAGGGAGAGGQAGAGGGTTTAVDPCGPAAPGPLPEMKLTKVVTDLSRPVHAGSAPKDATRLFVVEQHEGRVRVVKNGALLPEPFLSIGGCGSGITCGNEQGFLGLAFHPGYPQNGRFYVDYTDDAGNTVVAEYQRDPNDADKALPASKKVLLTITQPFSNHNGGGLAFGKDGHLYVGMGDGGSAGDPLGNGQNLQSRLGKLLRLDVESHPQPPAGNLPGGDAYIWDYGLRNPWRFSFDRCTGDLYIGDVGQGAFEEVDIEPAGQGHKNYGWNVMEGSQCYSPPCDQAGLTLPVAEYSHASGGCSVTGGFVYRGTKISGLVGWYLYGDYCSGKVWALAWVNGALAFGPVDVTKDLGGASISSFGQDEAGELYVVDLSGTVYRIDPA